MPNYLFEDYVPMPDHFFSDLKPLSQKISQEIQASKYGMLEIFRHTYNRIEAVLTMRRLSKRFFKLSQDNYLENFN